MDYKKDFFHKHNFYTFKVNIDDTLKNNDLIYIMEQRHNIKFFDQDNIPDKKIIEDILEESHRLVPHKNNLMPINITVWGPEYVKEKEQLVLNTVCGPGRYDFTKGGKYYGDYNLLKKLYDEWRYGWLNKEHKDRKKFRDKWGLNFNEQVRAPYLLVFTQRLRTPSPTQQKRGYKSDIWERHHGFDDKGFKWYLNAGFHGYGLSLLSVNKGLSASFCKCITNLPYAFTPIIKPIYESSEFGSIAFVLGIGYRNKNVKVTKDANKIDIEEYINWK